MLRFETPEQAKEWFEKHVEEAAQRAIVATAARLVAHIQNVVIPQTKPQPVDRGVYRAGWRFKALDKGADVYNIAAHAPMVEYGVRADRVSFGAVGPISEWVKRKLHPGPKKKEVGPKKPGKKKAQSIRQRIKKLIKQLTNMLNRKEKPTNAGGGGKKSPQTYTDAQARRIAFAIVIKMKQRGIFDNGKGLHVLKRAEPKVQPFFSAEIKRELKRTG